MNGDRRQIDSQFAALEVRGKAGEQRQLVGYAAVFYRADNPGTQFELRPGVVERIMPGAFDDVLRSDADLVALFNHNPSALLGRRSAGTLRLSVDDIGLRYEIDIPDTQWGRDTITSAERGDLRGSSFAFRTPQDGTRMEHAGGALVRSVVKVSPLLDVGPVTYPAYDGTAVMARDTQATIDRELAAIDADREAEAAEIDVRLRSVEMDDFLLNA